MKNLLLSAVTSVALFGSSAFATPSAKMEDVATNYTHRVVALQPALSYERIVSDAPYFGFETYMAPALRGENDSATVFSMEARFGYNYAIDDRSSVTPIVGVSMFRDMGETKIHFPQKDGSLREYTVTSPYFFHGTLGFMSEYNFTSTVGLGLTAKALIGSQWGASVEDAKDLSYGFHGAVPVTFRFGSNRHWDLRLEPFTTILPDYANYAGLKSSVGYRF